MMLAHLLDETFAGARWFAAFGVLLILVAVTALAALGRRPILALLRPLLRWLGIRTPDVAPLDEPSGEIPPFVDQAMDNGHRRPGPRVQPAVCPDPPTQVLPRVDDDATQVLPHAALNAPTQVLYIVLPVDERERAR